MINNTELQNILMEIDLNRDFWLQVMAPSQHFVDKNKLVLDVIGLQLGSSSHRSMNMSPTGK